jgi:hypothetical protein
VGALGETNMQCKVCGTNTVPAFRMIFRRENREDMVDVPDLRVPDIWTYHECLWCHALQTEAMDQLTWKEMEQFYQYKDSYIKPSKNRADRAVRFVNRARRMFPQPTRRLLCYGAGISPEPEMFRGQNWTVDTCDIGKGYTFSPEEFAEVKTFYDVITSMEVIEHFRRPRETLSEILQHLTPGGIFVASTGLWSRVPEEHKNKDWYYIKWASEGHIFIWTLQALDMVAQENDCYVVVLGNTPKLCVGMQGIGQAPIIIRRYGKEDL